MLWPRNVRKSDERLTWVFISNVHEYISSTLHVFDEVIKWHVWTLIAATDSWLWLIAVATKLFIGYDMLVFLF